MREPWKLDNKEYLAMADDINVQEEDEIFGEDWLDSYLTNTILDAKYEKVDVKDVSSQQKYLTLDQQRELEQVLEKYTKLFDATLGVYSHKKFHTEVEDNAVPKHSRPYAVANIHLEAIKKELKHLVKIGVLSETGSSEWQMSITHFYRTQKRCRIQWVSNLRHLNKVVVQRQYPLPIINDILQKRIGYKYSTKLDILMQYYTFELDKES